MSELPTSVRGKAGRFIRGQRERLELSLRDIPGLPMPHLRRSEKFEHLAKLGYRADPETGQVTGVMGRPLRTKHLGYPVIRSNCMDPNFRSSTVWAFAHRFIWEWINGPIPSGLFINHINGVKSDNRVENLELVTSRENILHAYRTGLANGLSGESNSMSKLTAEKVEFIRRNRTITGKELASRFGVSQAAISLVRNYKTWGEAPCRNY